MNYTQAIEYVHGIPKFVRPLGNEKLGGLLDLLGNPHNSLKFIHVAGTNGKGSVCTMTAEILKCAGYKTGLFTSPFIEIFNERIRINGEVIKSDVLARYITDIAEIMEENNVQVSEFAFITAVAMKFFADEECDIVVLETGMGGRLDATNIIPAPVCAVITSISLDHTEYLGDTIEKIAHEKCGIIKHGSDVVSAPNDEAAELIKTESEKAGAKLRLCGKSIKTEQGFIYKSKEYTLGLKGEYQSENASVVYEIIGAMRERGYGIPEKALEDGYKYSTISARYEFLPPNIIIDGGHNPGGIDALKKSLAKENKPITLVLAMMKDKDYRQCISDIVSVAECVVATEIDMPRCLKAEEIKKVCRDLEVRCVIEHDTKKAIDRAKSESEDGLVCICGSLYLAGDAKHILKGG